jgi:signal transduction histidine kinase
MRALFRPLAPFGWRPSALVRLVANLAFATLFTGLAAAYAAWSFQTEPRGYRLRSVEQLENVATPIWFELMAIYQSTTPTEALPGPLADPHAALTKLLASQETLRAFYLDPHGRLTVMERKRHYDPGPELRTYQLDLPRYRPDLTLLAPIKGPFTLEEVSRQALLAYREEFSLALYRNAFWRDGLDRKAFYGEVSGIHEGRPIFVTGSPRRGYLGYETWRDSYISMLGNAVLEQHGLRAGSLWFTTMHDARWMQLSPSFDLPKALHEVHLEAGPSALEPFDRAIDQEAMGVLPLLLLLALVRLWRAGQALRALLAERAVALAQSNFVAAVTHELRTPLTTIKLYAEMLAQDVVTEPARRTHYLETIAGESERLGRLIENVLEYARIGGRRKAYRFEPVDLRELVQEALAAVQGPLSQAGLAVELHAPMPVVAPADRDALVQALINLLGNAAKYAADGQRVVVSALPEADGVALRVQDFGPGIPAAEQAKVFQPFYRVGSELTRTTTGSGLGLALVAETARAHGGRVELESAPGRGSEFKLVLPAP